MRWRWRWTCTHIHKQGGKRGGREEGGPYLITQADDGRAELEEGLHLGGQDTHTHIQGGRQAGREGGREGGRPYFVTQANDGRAELEEGLHLGGQDSKLDLLVLEPVKEDAPVLL